jgi:uncharacterized protein YbcI
VHENAIICILHDGLTKGERSLVEDGREDAVLQMRHTYQGTMRTELIAVVERLTGRKVAAFMSDNHIAPDVAVETFVLELRDGPPIVSEDDTGGRAPAETGSGQEGYTR